MRLATVRHRGLERVAIALENPDVVALLAPGRDMLSVIREGRPGPDLVDDAVEARLDEVHVLAPIPRPARNIMCVGKNYREHAREFARSGYEAGATTDVDERPALFSKLPSTVVGPGDEIDLHPDVTDKVDYEAELAVVIGRGGRGIRREDAYGHVFGYTILNDVTARDLQKSHKQWFLGKSLDTFAPMGPWIATAGGVDPERLEVTCHVNGELRQRATTADLIFDIPTLIATLSAGITLAPGDIIATGTPAGVGIGLDPPQFLKEGDTVEISISGIGTLANRCVARAAARTAETAA